MKADDVDPVFVEKVARIIARRAGAFDVLGWDREAAAEILAAVLPDARYAAKVEAVTEARKVISQYLATAEKWRYDRVMWAFAIILGEVPEDTPCPDSPADARERAARAARLATTTEEPTT